MNLVQPKTCGILLLYIIIWNYIITYSFAYIGGEISKTVIVVGMVILDPSSNRGRIFHLALFPLQNSMDPSDYVSLNG